MARRLVDAGFETSVWNRTAAKMQPLIEAGASGTADPATLGGACDMVGLCLPEAADCRQVLIEGGLLEALPESGIVLNHSTIGPQQARELADLCHDLGRNYLDAPVSGGPPGAIAGTLCVMVGGDAQVLQRARPVLDSFAGTIVHVAGPGTGQVAKLANNLSVLQTYVGVQEAFELATRYGVDPATLLEVLSAATANSHTLQTRAPVAGLQPKSPASNDWKPGFATDMMAKDIDLALQAAEGVELEVAGTELGRALLGIAQQAGLGDEDFSALAKLMHRKV
jgi:3-hydroxyisobutyrate dehydrogenase